MPGACHESCLVFIQEAKPKEANMKRSLLTIFVLLAWLLLIWAPSAQAEFPKTFTSTLPHGATAITTASISNRMQNAQVSFAGPTGYFGNKTIYLYLNKLDSEDLTLQSGQQKLTIQLIQFTPAGNWAGNTVPRSTVKITGSVTDAVGKNPLTFDKVIAQWSIPWYMWQ
jgi:hypothetical protein